jgi:Ca-activated chloride channel homolog
MNALLQLHFLRPWWLLVALPPLFAVLIRFLASRKSDQWDDVIAPHLLKYLVIQPSKNRWFSPEVVLLPFALVMAVAMAGPAYRLADTPEGPNDTTLLVAVDLSSSMNGQDIGPSRIGRLRLPAARMW